MSWETPVVVEINMSAEIGAYQGEEEDSFEPTLAPAILAPSDAGAYRPARCGFGSHSSS